MTGHVCLRRTHDLVLAGALLAVLATSCGRPYQPQPLDTVPFRTRAMTQRSDAVRVTAAVPGPDEAEGIFGFPIYESDIQPVWLEIENGSAERVRFAPVSVDPLYFAPLEVAYTHRGPFTGQGRDNMDRRFFTLAMGRYIDPGETASGFVFTHAHPGTKRFNVDVFGEDKEDHTFTFLIPVPGFTPDHSDAFFEQLYPPSALRDGNADALRAALSALPCCATGPGGGQGMPLNVVMIGEGEDVLHALTRAGWYEHARSDDEAVQSKSERFDGRPPDVTFRQRDRSRHDRDQLDVWLSPLRLNGAPVWIAQVSRRIGRTTRLGRALFDPRLDPDVDHAREHMLQVMWYSQGLQQYAWHSTGQPAAMDTLRATFSPGYYFTDGYRSVMWLSGAPVSLVETGELHWDIPPAR
jgi:hypothetical protein